MKRRKIIIITGIIFISTITSAFSFRNRNTTDVFPLQNNLEYIYMSNKVYGRPIDLLADIIHSLDIENNERYLRTGVVYKNGKAYEIPVWEVEDFNIKVSHYNTYCNVFTIDVLNILANTLGDETYRITKTPISANTLRNRFNESLNWIEVDKQDAVENVQAGNIVILSYVKQPHGHVSFVRNDSNKDNIYLWNVGLYNGNKIEWKTVGDTKYFVKVN